MQKLLGGFIINTDGPCLIIGHRSSGLPAERDRVQLQRTVAGRTQLTLVAAVKELTAEEAIIREDQLKSSLQKGLKHAICYHIIVFMLKKLILVVLMSVSLTPVARAIYPSDVIILDKAGIARLTDDQLIDAYENTLVEIQASQSFHATSGFSPKEYKEYKNLLKFRLLLVVEIHSRNLEIPQF